MTFLAVLNDLIFQSKLQAAATAAGAALRLARESGEAVAASEGVSAVFVDLHLPGALEAIQALRQRHPQTVIIGFGSHVETELLAAAQAAGCTQALPRSAFVQQLPTLLRGVQ